MGEVGETFKAFREAGRERRAENLKKSTAILMERGITFDSKNDGFHLIIRTATGTVNFYPSTGLYNGAFEGRGVFNLLKELEKKMSREKFTPGPWKVMFEDKTKVVFETQGVCEFVADTYAAFIKPQEEQEANAKLISAAPEMYRKLKELADVLRFGGMHCTNRTMEQEIEELLRKARGEK